MTHRVRLTWPIIGCAALSAAPTCDGGSAPPDAGALLEFTAPQIGELIPGGTIAIGWDSDWARIAAAPSPHLAVALISREADTSPSIAVDGTVAPPGVAPGPMGMTWAGAHVDGVPVPPGFYGLRATIGGAEVVDGGDLHIIVVQGATFTAPVPGATLDVRGSDSPALGYTTTTIEVLALDLVLDPDPQQDGDEVVLARRSIPGELRTVARTVTWAATDVDGAAIPAGDYQLAALISDGDVSYRVDGGRLHWEP